MQVRVGARHHSGYVATGELRDEALRIQQSAVRREALELWDHLAGWYQREMGMTNSEVLAPIESDASPFAFVNHASWDISFPAFFARQMSKRTFHNYVLGNLRANQIGALPYMYRPLPNHLFAGLTVA